jgi:outer membrane receptor for ferrienterochelin and colicin
MSERRTLSGKQADGFFLANLTFFGRQFFKGVELTGSIQNLFDERYGDPGSAEHRQDIIEQDRRTFWLKLKYGF